jgi:hypothetical protein
LSRQNERQTHTDTDTDTEAYTDIKNYAGFDFRAGDGAGAGLVLEQEKKQERHMLLTYKPSREPKANMLIQR